MNAIDYAQWQPQVVNHYCLAMVFNWQAHTIGIMRKRTMLLVRDEIVSSAPMLECAVNERDLNGNQIRST